MCKMKKKAQILWTQLEVCCPEKQLSFGGVQFCGGVNTYTKVSSA